MATALKNACFFLKGIPVNEILSRAFSGYYQNATISIRKNTAVQASQQKVLNTNVIHYDDKFVKKKFIYTDATEVKDKICMWHHSSFAPNTDTFDDGHGIPVVLEFVNGTRIYHGYGMFCCDACRLAYIEDELRKGPCNPDYEMLVESRTLLLDLWNLKHPETPLLPALDWRCQTRYGGGIRPENYFHRSIGLKSVPGVFFTGVRKHYEVVSNKVK